MRGEITVGGGQEKRIVLVLGMGRSGTSTITAGIGAIGVHLHGDYLEADAFINRRGFYEDKAFLDLDKRAQRLMGVLPGTGIAHSAPGGVDHAGMAALKADAEQLLRHRVGERRCWGFKAGNIALLPLWQEIISGCGWTDSYVLAIRNPASVAASTARWGGLDRRVTTDPRVVYSVWLQYYTSCLRWIWQRPTAVLDYDLLMADPVAQLRRTAETIQVSWNPRAQFGAQQYATEFLSPDLRHYLHSTADLQNDPRAPKLVGEAWRWFSRLARDEIRLDDPDFRAAWRELENAVEGLAPVFNLVQERTRRSGAELLFGAWRYRCKIMLMALNGDWVAGRQLVAFFKRAGRPDGSFARWLLGR